MLTNEEQAVLLGALQLDEEVKEEEQALESGEGGPSSSGPAWRPQEQIQMSAFAPQQQTAGSSAPNLRLPPGEQLPSSTQDAASGSAGAAAAARQYGAEADGSSMRLLSEIVATEAELSQSLAQHPPMSLAMMGASKRLIELYNTAAMLVLDQGDVALAEQLLEKALLLTEASGVLRPWETLRISLRATVLNNQGCCWRKAGRPNKALAALQEAVLLDRGGRGSGGMNASASASTHLNLCATLSTLCRHRVALSHAQMAAKLLAEHLDLDLSDLTAGLRRRAASFQAASSPPEPTCSQLRYLAAAFHNAGVEQEHLKAYSHAAKSFASALAVARMCGSKGVDMQAAFKSLLSSGSRDGRVRNPASTAAAASERRHSRHRRGTAGEGPITGMALHIPTKGSKNVVAVLSQIQDTCKKRGHTSNHAKHLRSTSSVTKERWDEVGVLAFGGVMATAGLTDFDQHYERRDLRLPCKQMGTALLLPAPAAALRPAEAGAGGEGGGGKARGNGRSPTPPPPPPCTSLINPPAASPRGAGAPPRAAARVQRGAGRGGRRGSMAAMYTGGKPPAKPMKKMSERGKAGADAGEAAAGGAAKQLKAGAGIRKRSFPAELGVIAGMHRLASLASGRWPEMHVMRCVSCRASRWSLVLLLCLSACCR